MYNYVFNKTVLRIIFKSYVSMELVLEHFFTEMVKIMKG